MKTQSEPTGNEVRPEILQKSLDQLFGYAHEHLVKTTAPTSKDGIPGDIVPVNLSGTYYLYIKITSTVWARVALTAV